MDTSTIKVSISRFDPASGSKSYMQEYYVDTEPGDTVLSVLKKLYEEQDHSLAFYYSCRIGKCAGCQVKVNGKVRLACTETVTGDIVLEPQPGYRVIKDLYVDKHNRVSIESTRKREPGMVKLTDYEQRMLQGEMGPLKQRAIKKIVDYAKALGAEELCAVTKATVALGFQTYLDAVTSENYEEIFSKMFLCSEKIYHLEPFSGECFSQSCSAPCDHFRHEEINISKEVFDKNRRFLDLVREVGVSTAGTCTPYLSGWIPLRGEHFVSTESSNILFANSVYGACANSDGMEAAAWSAICGRTPLWGNHILSNRYATCVVDVRCKSGTPMDWDLMGYALGRLLTEGGARPVLTGSFCRPDLNRIKKFFGALATTSGCEICHIVGCTAEAPTLEAALAGHEPEKRMVLTQELCDQSLASLGDWGCSEVQMVALGCPHCSLEEIRDIAGTLKGKKVADGVSLQIWTSLAMQHLAEINGYAQTIRAAGAHLLNSGCPLVCGRTVYDMVKSGFASDSAKQAHYVHTDLNNKNCKVFYGDTERCINAAITGRWEGR